MRTARTAWLRLVEFDEDPPEFVLPEDLGSLDDDALAALLDEASGHFDQLYDAGDRGDSGYVEALTQLRDAIRAISGEQEVRAERRAEIDRMADEVRREVHGAPEDETPTETPEEAGEDEDETEDERRRRESEQEQPDAVAASAPVAPIRAPTRVNLSALRNLAPRVRVENANRQDVVITAGADIPGYSTGGELHDIAAVTAAMQARARNLPVRRDAEQGMPSRYAVAQFDYGHLLPTINGGQETAEEDYAVIQRVADPANLVAAGGWCAPLQPVYDLFRLDAADGLFQLPTVRTVRGGLMLPSALVLPADLSALVWKWTAQNDIDAGTPGAPDPTKPCVRVPCPTWSACTLDAYGICVTAGNLLDRSFPELVREYVQMVLNAHAHAMSGYAITMVEANSTAIAGPTVGSATSSVLSALELAAEFYRSKYRMALNAPLEAVVPSWLRAALRADLSAREGVDLINVSDATLNGYLAARNLRVQFVLDWQPLANATAWPTAVKTLMYPAGTWVQADGGTLDLGVVRDSTLNAINDFTAAFTESFLAWCKQGAESLVVTVPLDISGCVGCGAVAAP